MKHKNRKAIAINSMWSPKLMNIQHLLPHDRYNLSEFQKLEFVFTSRNVSEQRAEWVVSCVTQKYSNRQFIFGPINKEYVPQTYDITATDV